MGSSGFGGLRSVGCAFVRGSGGDREIGSGGDFEQKGERENQGIWLRLKETGQAEIFRIWNEQYPPAPLPLCPSAPLSPRATSQTQAGGKE